MTIDELMVAFKGRHSAKVYMPKKPTKWGYKHWCRARISGYIYDFEVVDARNTKGPLTSMNLSTALGESEYPVLRLCETLEPAKHKIFFDNLFSSPELMKYMMEKRMYAVATLRLDRYRKCPLSSERDLKKKGTTYNGRVC